MWRPMSALQSAGEQAHGAHPGILRGGGVIDFRAGIIEKSMVGVRVDSRFAMYSELLEGLLEAADFVGIDPAVFSSGNEEYRALDVFHLVDGVGQIAVEDSRRFEGRR